jgi:hypothetical protein
VRFRVDTRLASFLIGFALAVVTVRLAPIPQRRARERLARTQPAPGVGNPGDLRPGGVFVLRTDDVRERTARNDTSPTPEITPTAEPLPAATATALATVAPVPTITPGPRAQAAPPSAGDAIADLDGWWLVTNSVESTDHAPYRGLRLSYRLELRQDGERVVGKGTTWTRNGKPLPLGHRTPVVASGTRREDRVELRIVEHGQRGDREGRIDWRVSPEAARLEGRFASVATNTSGRSEASREGADDDVPTQGRGRARGTRRR